MTDFENKIYEALRNALLDENFVLSEFDFRGDETDFEIEFVCYGIYHNRFKELLSEVNAVFADECSQKVFISAEQYALKDYALFLISTDENTASYTHKCQVA